MNTFSRFARMCMAALVVMLGLMIPTGAAHATTGATLTVNSNSDAESASDGVCTLREAINAVLMDLNYNECINSSGFAYGDDSINFSISGSATITLTAAFPFISPGTGTLTIEGSNGGSPITIDGANTYQVLNIGTGATVTLSNLTIQHGSAAVGGGVISNGTLIVLRSSFLNNTASSDGGAIENGGILNISNSTFYGNSANYGGGVMNNSGTVTISNSTFSGNTVSTHGGALSTYWGGTLAPVTTIYNTIMANSTAPEDCFRFGGTGTMTGSNNIIEVNGGGVPDCSGVTTFNSDPNLGALTGSPVYFPLNTGSPAIDTGNNTICTSAPVNSTSQNGIPRPQDGNNDSVRVCDIGAYEKPATLNVRSSGALDGWVLESSETSNLGGTTRDALATTLRLGDDTADRQYRAVLSFPTASLPDNAVITQVTLKVRKQGNTGVGDPATVLQGFKLDVKKGFFGSTTGLESLDFQAAIGTTGRAMGPFTPPLVSGWYSLSLTSARAYINKASTNGGVTQVRLRFKLDDNDNLAANVLSLYSGNATTTSYRPLLTVVYYVP